MTAAACMSVQPCVPYDYGGNEKRLFAMPFYAKHDHLPRQARDKHGVALKALKWRRVSAGSFGNEPGAPVTGQPFQSSVYGVELAQAPPAQTRPGAMAAIPYVVQIAKTRCEKRRPFLSHTIHPEPVLKSSRLSLCWQTIVSSWYIRRLNKNLALFCPLQGAGRSSAEQRVWGFVGLLCTMEGDKTVFKKPFLH
jgi:hypothetical protein